MSTNFGVFDLLGETWLLTKQFLAKRWKILFFLWLVVAICLFLVTYGLVGSESSFFRYSLASFLNPISIISILISGTACLVVNTKVYLEMGEIYGYDLPQNYNSLKYLMKKTLISIFIFLFIALSIMLYHCFSKFLLHKHYIFAIVGWFSSLIFVHFILLCRTLCFPIFLLTRNSCFRKFAHFFKLLNKKKLVVFATNYFHFIFKFGMLFLLILVISILENIVISLFWGEHLGKVAFEKIIYKVFSDSFYLKTTLFLLVFALLIGAWVITNAYGLVLHKKLTSLEKK